MTNFELFSLIYFVLDAEYDSSDKSDEQLMHFVSELNPFLWAEESSADPAYYEEFKSFMKDKTIGSDMGYSLALEFLSNDIYYSKIPEYFQKTTIEEWISAAKEYLSEPHKGSTN